MRVTREDVAAHAGVSPATVSYVLNRTRHFSEDTVKRVMDSVAELGYRPDMIARSMVTQETHQLAIVMDSLVNPYYGEIALGFEDAAVKKGYFINICSGQNNLDSYFSSFVSRRIDGLLILALPDKYHPNNLYHLVDQGIKIVSGGMDDIDLKRMSMLDVNYGEGMRLALDHLFALGHREILYLSSLTGHEQHDTRSWMFLDYMQKQGIDGARQIVVSDRPYASSIEDGYRITERLLKSGRRPTALICTNDLMAIGATQALKAAGLRVPEDMSVVGFDNIVYGARWSPSITSVTHDKRLFGKKAFDLLYNNIHSDITGFYRADVSLYLGASTAPPPSDRLV